MPEKGEWFWKDVQRMADWCGGEERGVQPVLVDAIDRESPEAEADRPLFVSLQADRPFSLTVRLIGPFPLPIKSIARFLSLFPMVDGLAEGHLNRSLMVETFLHLPRTLI